MHVCMFLMANSTRRFLKITFPMARPWWWPIALLLLGIVYPLFTYSPFLHLLFPLPAPYKPISPYPQCTSNPLVMPHSVTKLPYGEKYMFYAPHSGFTNQLGELKNALIIAALLNRTLILPPIFDHHAVWLGSCPKYRVLDPYKIRTSAWSHISELIYDGRYVAIADVIDLSTILSSSVVKTVDLRVFLLLWCGADVRKACSGPLCDSMSQAISTWGTLESCATLLSTPKPADNCCVYGVNDDCRTTIWIHGLQRNDTTRLLLATDKSLYPERKKKKRLYKRRQRDILEALGRGSEAAEARVLSFGSLFSSEYKGEQLHVDIRNSGDNKISTLLHALELLPFAPDLMNAGTLYVKTKIRRPFFCAQVRLLDGQFKNRWAKIFSVLKDHLERTLTERLDSSEVLDVFLMTDLPPSNWTNTYLAELAANTSRYRLHMLDETERIITDTSKQILKKEYGLRSGFLPQGLIESFKSSRLYPRYLPEIRLFVEEVICSCASLGFRGTSGSTIADNIVRFRNASICSDGLH